jgi:hypothetical protein
MAMLTEMQNVGQPCWNWREDQWISLFDKYRRGKPLMMAFAYHLGPFTSPLQILMKTLCRFTPVPSTATRFSGTS